MNQTKKKQYLNWIRNLLMSTLYMTAMVAGYYSTPATIISYGILIVMITFLNGYPFAHVIILLLISFPQVADMMNSFTGIRNIKVKYW